ncbi:MAG: response regulator [Proteobacteria bacterium]|nr:response regulator [Pseudomonadota bacterium]MBU1687404.1 response regulator [Pseudomonadota bacterium]
MKLTKIQKILVVADHEIMGQSIKRHLKREGFAVDISQDVSVAKDLVLAAAQAGTQFGLILFDIKGPRYNVFTLIAWLNRDFPEIAVLVVSGFGNADLPDLLLRPEFDCFYKKPVLPREIVTAIRSIEKKKMNQAGRLEKVGKKGVMTCEC